MVTVVVAGVGSKWVDHNYVFLVVDLIQGQVSHRRRLQEEFGEPQDCIPPVTPKPGGPQLVLPVQPTSVHEL